MKVLMINVVCGIRSTGRICTDLATILEEQGHEVKIAYGREFVPEQFQKYAIRIGTDLDVKLHAIKARLFDGAGFGSKRATLDFIAWVEQYNPDIIHLHNLHGYYVNVEILFEYLRNKRKKVIWTMHDCWGYTGHCTHYSFYGCEKWKYICRGKCNKYSYPKTIGISNCKKNYLRKKSAFSNIDMRLVVPSQWLKDEIEQSFLGDYEINIINNGIDLNIFRPTESELRSKYNIKNKIILLAVSNGWVENKGFNDLLSLSKMIDEKYVIVVIGINQKQKNMLGDNMIGLSTTNNIRELVEWYSVADYYINPSKEETMGMTTLEALACGTPAITYNLTAIPEVLSNGCGEAVCPYPEEIRSVLYSNRFEIEKCLDRAAEYDKNIKYSEYIEIYDKIFTEIR